MNASPEKKQLQLSRMPHLLGLVCFLLAFFLVNSEASATITLTPSTWNIVGLDSNSPATGPRYFPVGAKVCSDSAAANDQAPLLCEYAVMLFSDCFCLNITGHSILKVARYCMTENSNCPIYEKKQKEKTA